jgi:hypothetical protein
MSDPPHRITQPITKQTSRVAINIEKMKLLKQRLSECVRREGAAHLDRCEQLTRRYEASVRVCQWNAGPNQRPRNTGDIMTKDTAVAASASAAREQE